MLSPKPIKEKDKDIYDNAMNGYRNKQNELNKQFKHDALDDVGLLNHPKADRIFAYAERQGHSSGMYEVYNILCELADLFTDDKY